MRHILVLIAKQLLYLRYATKEQASDTLVVNIVNSVTLRRVLAIGNHHTVVVVRLLVAPSLLDRRQDCAASLWRCNVDIRRWVCRLGKVIVERAGKRTVLEDGLVGTCDSKVGTVDVACLLCDSVEDIGTHVPTTQRVETPVGL